MAGGVTSGIIYPGAVAMIARRYSFHSIGGTSVGAIAAAVTAAAEYGRRTGRNPGSFDGIAAIPASLGEKAPDGHSRLFHLFTPDQGEDHDTRPLMALLAPLISSPGMAGRLVGLVGAILRSWPSALAIAACVILGALPVIALVRDGRVTLGIIAAVAATALAAISAVAALGVTLRWRWLPAWRRNGYGICTGMASPAFPGRKGKTSFEGLMPWLHNTVQTAAGRTIDDDPLTFGDLWSAPRSDGTAASPVNLTAPRSIELEMITSDISRNRAAQLPFIEAPSPVYVSVAVLERHFPKPLVRWMVQEQGDPDPEVELPKGTIRLPPPHHLPIAFAARLSLSFPVLLSALPLLTPDFGRKTADGKIPLRRLWFSDGGLTSNFPIHFFDSPMPTRPTFCLNLVDYNAELVEEPSTSPEAEAGADEVEGALAKAKEQDERKPITESRSFDRKAENRPAEQPTHDPKPKDPVWKMVAMTDGHQLQPVPFTTFDSGSGTGVGAFLSALFNTARAWSDNQMLIAPGVRDRVVHIALRSDEGGLNLDMDANVIAELDLRGRAAGMLIAARFDPNAQTDPETGAAIIPAFANHRWVRYRNFMAAFEDLSRRFAAARRKSDEEAAKRREPTLDEMIDGRSTARIGYPVPASARAFFRQSTRTLERFAIEMAKAQRDDPSATFDRARDFHGAGPKAPPGAAPRPKMGIRLRPLIDNDPRTENADPPGDWDAPAQS